VRLAPRPTVYEINTAVWLTRLAQDGVARGGLRDVPGEHWDALAGLPVDAVWLMGVWQRSPAGLAIALGDPTLQAGNQAALPDLHPEDVIGSPYCVRDYVVDDRFWGPDGLAAAREQLARRGLGLILDYVPNHVAPDHPWLTERPDCFLPGTDEELAQHPEAFLPTAGGVVAKGRDPYFPPWPDVVQLNAFAPALRDAVADMLIGVGAQCDGLRCDMAMLMTNEVFARTWGERAGSSPRAEFWPVLIERVRSAHPDLLFMAEAYWDMEWTLEQQGFDLC
jgi:glycosidase